MRKTLKRFKGLLFVFAVIILVNTQEVMALHTLPMPTTGNTYTVGPWKQTLTMLIPANLDGDDKTDWVGMSKPNDGHVLIEARTYSGNFLWEFNTQGGYFESGAFWDSKQTACIVWDIDSDGKDEVITVRHDATITTKVNDIVVLNGLTGDIKAEIPLPWHVEKASPRLYACIAYLDGPNGKPSLITYSSTYLWGTVWAFDWKGGTLKLRWTYQHYGRMGTGTHGIYSYDVDGDGRDDVLDGGTILTADGTQIFSLSDLPGEPGHVDSVCPGDINPSNPGVEILFCIETGVHPNGNVILTTWDGNVLWSKTPSTTSTHIHSGWVANINNSYAGEEIRGGTTSGALHNKDVEFTYDCNGNKIDDGNSYRSGRRVPEWTGDGLYDVWPADISNPLYAADLGGGDNHGAEEIVQLNGLSATIYFNKSANSYPSRWANRNYRKDVITVGSGYTIRTQTFRVMTPVAPADYAPTPYITIDGKRTIGYRKMYTESGAIYKGNRNKVIRGRRFIALKGEQLQFRGSTSWDSDGDSITSYQWDFGDGQSSTQADPIHKYSTNGTYNAKLTIQADGKTSIEELSVDVNDQIKNYFTALPHQVIPYNAKVGEKIYVDGTETITTIPSSLTNLTYKPLPKLKIP